MSVLAPVGRAGVRQQGQATLTEHPGCTKDLHTTLSTTEAGVLVPITQTGRLRTSRPFPVPQISEWCLGLWEPAVAPPSPTASSLKPTPGHFPSLTSASPVPNTCAQSWLAQSTAQWLTAEKRGAHHPVQIPSPASMQLRVRCCLVFSHLENGDHDGD